LSAGFDKACKQCIGCVTTSGDVVRRSSPTIVANVMDRMTGICFLHFSSMERTRS
jgi:hypothetical protein